MKTLRVVLVGIGGYGRHFYEEVVRRGVSNGLHCAAVVQPTIRRHPQMQAELADLRIPVYPSLEGFYSDGGKADLAVIASPLPYHFEQCVTALDNGTHVLCEKPVTVGWQEAQMLDDLSRKRGLLLAVGYQNSYSDAVLALKNDIAQGRYGQALSLSTLLLSGRSTAYYTRSIWAGKLADDQGRLILDGVANNAGAHSLHLMMYLLGSGPDDSAQPVALEADLARVNSIQTYDMAALRIKARHCSEILFFGSHAYAGEPVTAYRFVFEKGSMAGDLKQSDELAMRTPEGIVCYGPVALDALRPLRETISAIRTGGFVPCGVHAATPQTACIQGLHAAIAEVSAVSGEDIEKVSYPDGQVCWQVPSMNQALRACFEKGKLPHELSFPGWTTGSVRVCETSGQQSWK